MYGINKANILKIAIRLLESAILISLFKGIGFFYFLMQGNLGNLVIDADTIILFIIFFMIFMSNDIIQSKKNK